MTPRAGLMACLLLAALPAAPVTGRQAAATVYEGARLITGDGGAPIEDAAFVVENARFTVVGRRGTVSPPPGASRVDLTGKTVIPGLVPGIHSSACVGACRKLDPRDKPEDDSGALYSAATFGP